MNGNRLDTPDDAPQMSLQEMRKFEFDFCVACNMQLGLSFDEAQIAAKQWMDEANEQV